MGGADNSTILKNTEYALNQLRDMLSIPEPKHSEPQHSNQQTLKKFHEYQAIAYIDLEIYSCAHEELSDAQWQPLTLSNPMITELLFGGGVDPDKVKRTIKPFYDNKLLNSEYMEMLFANIRNDRELLSRPMDSL